MRSSVPRRPLGDEVADRLRDAIFAGEFPPGTQLVEAELAAELDVSRGPIREAFARLEREGLVRTVLHKGAKVVTLTAADAEEIYTLRVALEQLAVTRAGERAAGVDFDGLRQLVNQMAKRVAAASTAELVALDMDFHDLVYRLADHQRLYDAWAAVRSQVRLFLLARSAANEKDYRSRLVDDHHQIVVALTARSPRRIELAEQHVRTAYESLMSTMERDHG